MLDADVTPLEVLFIRNNGLVPDRASLDPAQWLLKIDGESAKNAMQFSIAD
ncbi:MAG: hypothetical protein ACR2FI_07525 [Burkholderiales bacterium]|nr:hypothetical protein [Burkholderiales bacterium]